MTTISAPCVELPLADAPWTPAEETVRRGSRLVSRKVGLIRRIRRGFHRPGDPALVLLVAEPGELGRQPGLNNAPRSSGAGETVEEALAATLGEAVERYCASFCDHRSLVLAGWRDLGEDAVAPELLRPYSRRQIEEQGAPARLAYFDEDTRLDWCWGYSLTAGRPRLAPASLVHMAYRPQPGAALIGRFPSSGLAAGATVEEAILSGLLEVIERDAFMIAWHHRRAGAAIEVDDPEIQGLLERRFFAGRRGVDIRFFDLTLETGVPTVMAWMRRPADFGFALCVSAATRLDPRRALRKTLYEQGQFFPYLRYLVGTGWQPRPDLANVDDFDRHALLYVRRPDLAREAFAFCEEVPRRIALSQIADRSTGRPLGDLQVCLDTLAREGHEVLVFELTTPDVAEAGFRVVRVLVPGLVPLHGDARPFLGPRRLAELPARLGWEREGWDPAAGPNPFPHPFP